MTKLLILCLAFLFLNNPLIAQEEKPQQFRIGVLVMPELSWYKPKENSFSRPSLGFLTLGLGLGGVVTHINYGLKFTYLLSPKLSLSTGFCMSKNGSKNNFQSTPYFHSKESGFTNVDEIDSSYSISHPEKNYCEVSTRKYSISYFMAPLLFQYNFKSLLKESETSFSVGSRLYFLKKATTIDEVNIYSPIDSTYNSSTITTTNNTDFRTVLASICIGLERELYNQNGLVLTFGWQFNRGLSNTVNSPSNYLMNKIETEKNFENNLKAVALNQKFQMNSISINFTVNYSF